MYKEVRFIERKTKYKFKKLVHYQIAKNAKSLPSQSNHTREKHLILNSFCMKEKSSPKGEKKPKTN